MMNLQNPLSSVLTTVLSSNLNRDAASGYLVLLLVTKYAAART